MKWFRRRRSLTKFQREAVQVMASLIGGLNQAQTNMAAAQQAAYQQWPTAACQQLTTTSGPTSNLTLLAQQPGPILGLYPGSGGTLPGLKPRQEGALSVGPIVARRRWGINADEGALTSQGIGSFEWPTEPKAAVCRASLLSGSHAAPQEGCSCGWYGLKQPWPQEVGYVDGAVAMWGRIIEHANGYRAEWAYPLALWPSWECALNPPRIEGAPWVTRQAPNAANMWTKLKARYNVPVYRSQAAFEQAYGQVVTPVRMKDGSSSVTLSA